MLKSYKELIVWQKAMDLVEEIYKLTADLPKVEGFGLISQMRRSAVSIPSNIAEGQKRKNLAEFLQFLRIADGSAAELETQLLLTKKLYRELDSKKSENLLEEVQKMLNVMVRKLEYNFLKTKSYKLKTNDGYLMVESLVAIMIVTAGLLGIFALLSRSLSLNRVVSDRFVAAYLAAEGIEIVKNVVDNNLIAARPWNEGLGDGDYELDYDDSALQANQNRPLKFDPISGLYSYSGPNPTNFQRTIQITNSAGGEEITVNSTVQWLTRGGGRFSINLEDHFFNWR